MPRVSLSRRVEQLSKDMDPRAHEVDLGVEVQGPDGKVLFRAGGTWHKRKARYVADSPSPHAIRLVSSQVRAAEELANWFRAYDARDPNRLALVNCVDERRGGKTYFVVAAMLSFAIRYPASHLGKTVVWIVVPTFPQQREIHETLTLLLPASWWRDGKIKYLKSLNCYRFATGAELWIKSADRPEGLKWGAVAAVGVNEAQQVEVRSILNIIGSNIDNGGLTALAMNPADSLRALWAFNLHEALKARDKAGKLILPFATEIPFPAAKNETIDQAGRTRYLKLAEYLDPKTAKRDGHGIWVALKDVAYPCYDRSHVRPEPAGWTDFTPRANALTGMVSRSHPPSLGGAMDFQRSPYCAFVEMRCLIAPEGAWVPKGTPVYVVRAEVCNDEAEDLMTWTEKLLCEKVAQQLAKRSLSPSDYLLIADATGKNQGASGAQRGKESDPDSWSWSIISDHGWDPHGPIEKQSWVSGGRGSSTLEVKPRNPRVRERLGLVNELLRDGRIVITYECAQTAEAFRTCAIRTESRKPYGKGSHLTDCVGYLVYAWEMAMREAGLVTVKTRDPEGG